MWIKILSTSCSFNQESLYEIPVFLKRLQCVLARRISGRKQSSLPTIVLVGPMEFFCNLTIKLNRSLVSQTPSERVVDHR